MRPLAAAVILPVALATGCVTSGSSANAHTATPQPTRPASTSGTAAVGSQVAGSATLSWPTYHRTDGRAGTATHAVALPLHHAWTAKLDGAVYGEALYVDNMVIAATENDSVYALRPSNGKVIWRKHLGTPESQSDLQHDQPGCGDIFPLGITGTPAYDAKTGSVFVVAETLGGHHTLWALKATTGRRVWHRSTDVVRRDRRAEQQRSALLVSSGRVFTSYGGLAGDCGNYVGYTTSTATTGNGKTTHYAVPTSREAGMWSPAGPVTGANGNIYVASGNGAEENGRWDKSDSVTELSPASMHRVAVFAPGAWKQDNIQDLDLGSSSPVPVDGRTVIAGKRGTVYLLHNSLGGVGSAIRSLGGCASYGGAAHVGHTVVMPCRSGIRALSVHKRSLRWVWTASGRYGSPIIAGKRVFLADTSSGDLEVLSLRTGHLEASMSIGGFTHFPSETVVGNQVFVPTLSGITAIKGTG
jgi:outer membrane protein assembly factor BamB